MRLPTLVAIALLAGAAAARADEPPTTPRTTETVALLHGLGRSDASMQPLAEHLAREGFRVVNIDYPSTAASPEVLVAEIERRLDVCCREADRLDFVTHSLGGILVRALLARERPPNLGRVVMLAPPNQGSEIVDASALIRWAIGPTGAELGTEVGSLPNRLPPPDYEVGVVAGTESINPVGSALIPDEDDGTVAVERTKLAGMKDFVTVPASHTFIMQDEEVARLVTRFLRTGGFR